MDSSSLKGSQLGKLVLSSGILDISWSRISELYESTYPSKDSALGIKIYQEAKCTVAVFVAPPICRNSSFNSASTLLSGSQDQNPFHFLCTENISSFSLHTPAFQLFSSAYKELSELKSELLLLLESKKPVIITGAALGGSVASLFTLWLLETIDTGLKRPLCITFGSPLLGDASLQEILENSAKESCFLHVADAAQTPITAGFFKPFGTFLICFDSQCICIDDPEAVMELLFCVNADLVDWRDYGEILHRLDKSMLSVADSRPISMSDDVINRMEERAAKKNLHFGLVKRLSDMKISMMYIDAFRNLSKKDKIGYYDRFKRNTLSPVSPFDIEVMKIKKELNDFWKSVVEVEEEEKRPQSEMSVLRRWCLFAGNNYRRIIEPLDIAEHYLSGRKDYRTSGRSHHYVALEKWFEESRVPVRCETRDLSNLLTFDSCFWAEVEEAMIVTNLLKTQEGMRDEALTRKLVRFEDYVMGLIGKREVSPEIFLEKSSFMRWWKEYKEIRGRDGFDASPSHLTEFMNTGIHYSAYGSFFLNLEDRPKGFVDEEDSVKVMKVQLSKDKEKTKAVGTVSQRQSSEVSSVGDVGASKKIEPKKESSKHQHKKSKVEMMSKKRKKNETEVEMMSKKKKEKSELSDAADSRTSVSTITNIPSLNMGNPKDEWFSFCEFLRNRLPLPLNLSSCRAEDVVDFLRTRQASGNKALVGRLSAAWDVLGVKLKENPFCSLAVTRYVEEMTRDTECILVFSWSDNDVDETLFIEAILKELHEREVTPLKYNLSGRESLDSEMLQRSSVGIMVLSTSFGQSSQSLDHLVAIMEQWKAKDFVIIPVYFKVTLADICRLEDRFEAVCVKYLSYVQADRVQKWKVAMTEMASIVGHQWTEGTKSMLVEEVVRNASLRLYFKNSENLVRILSLLNHSQPSEAEIVGIWGTAGIGKTAVAREIFGILAPRYDVCYFLQDFYSRGQMIGLRQMRDDFYSAVFGEEKLSIGACDVKPSFMRDWFHKKTILVVLDDVSNARDAEAVVGGFGWFSHGHRIILTSRRKQVLVQCKVTEVYEMQRLCEFESFRIWKQYLNGESVVFSELMSCSSGIPLAIKVLSSSVSKQHIDDMQEYLQFLRRNPPTQIQESFRRSFDGLDENEKNIFLDLACFFRGENKDQVVQLLDACGFLTYLGICDLIDESLISLVENRIEIPIPFQDIGRFIVHEEDKDPSGRSRLWDSNEIGDVLTNNSGTEAIEGIFLDTSDLACDCELSPTVFGKMYSLRLLKLYSSNFGNQCNPSLPQGLDTLPSELRLLHWENYPLEYLPQKFIPENLVEINMPYSKMEKLWEGKKNLEKLKKIKLSHSRKLTDILMLSEALNLEHIDLEGCTSLVDISTSIPRRGKLVSLNMKGCSRLESLPAMVDLTSLELLNLSGCSELYNIQDFAPNLKELYLAGTAIRELTLTIDNLSKLITLDLENCTRLQQLPSGIHQSRSIVELKLAGCRELKLRSMEVLRTRPSIRLLSIRRKGQAQNWRKARVSRWNQRYLE